MPNTRLDKNWAVSSNLTHLTNYKLISGLAHSAIKRPAFPSANRYTLGNKNT